MTQGHARTWPLKCPECGDRVRIDMPADVVNGLTGTAKCHRRHTLRFRYEVVTVTLVELLESDKVA